MKINYETVLPKYHAIVDRGLSHGMGKQKGQMCIEAAVCAALDLPHGDDPGCVASSVRSFKIALNDSRWSSEKARAEGLRHLGIAQLGSKGVVDDIEFVKRMADKTIRKLLPPLFREIFPNDPKCIAAALRCEEEGSAAAAAAAAAAATRYTAAAAARYAATAAAAADKYLALSANLAIEVLAELKSPGVGWMDWGRYE